MPASFLKRHRTICDTLEEIRAHSDDPYVHKLVDEAKQYAMRMSVRLVEYKKAHGPERLPSALDDL